jgi:hypothetical protein
MVLRRFQLLAEQGDAWFMGKRLLPDDRSSSE